MDPKNWNVELGTGMGSLVLGTPYREIVQWLLEAGLACDHDEDDPTFVYLEEEEMILTFAAEEPHPLLQIAVEDERVRFGTQPVIGRRLHELTELLHVSEGETVWRTEDDPDDSLPGQRTAQQSGTAPANELLLLTEGTLWVIPLGVGFRMDAGEICELYLRLPEHTPQLGVGKLTAGQLECSRRSDLARYLAALQQVARPRGSRFRSVCTGVLFALIGLVVWRAAQYQRQWQDAVTVEAEIIAVRPDSPESIPSVFTAAYTDQAGQRYEVELGLRDVYVPRARGDKIELKYLRERPGEPMSPGRLRDIAVEKFFPWVIGIFAGYLVVLLGSGMVGRLLRPPLREPVV